MTSVQSGKVETDPTVCLLDPRKSSKNQKLNVERCTKMVKSFLPITHWLPRYTLHNLQCDMIAGITVGLMVIPQGIAYATIAGLEPVYGLYTAFMGCFVYCFLGTSKDVTIGPTAIMSLMVNQYCQISKNNPSENVKFAIALSFFSGLIQFAMGFFRIGFIVRFISIPVISGFTSSAAIIIATGQVKSLLGLKNVRRPFGFCVYDTFKNIGETKTGDLVLGIICILTLLILRIIGRTKWPEDNCDASIKQRIARKTIWIFSTARNAVVVLMASLLAYAVVSKGNNHAFSLTTHISQGVPNFTVSFPFNTVVSVVLLLCCCCIFCLYTKALECNRNDRWIADNLQTAIKGD